MFCNERLKVLLLAMVVGGSLLTQQSIAMFATAYASESSPYDSGYDHGCEDAGRSESDKYINQPEKGPSFHTNEFMSGYYDGLSSCGGGGDGGQPDEAQPYQEPYYPPSQTGGINWENLCNQYGHLVGIKDPCYEYANGTQLTEKGRTALVCLLGGGITLLAGLDPATKAEIIALGQQYCP